MSLNVGFIGLGNIGKPCAKHLIRDGFVTRVFDVQTSQVQELAAQGALACQTIAEVATSSDHIGICVRDDQQVEKVLYGVDGVFRHAGSDTLVSIHSTVTR